MSVLAIGNVHITGNFRWIALGILICLILYGERLRRQK
jgi:hypothetical protein